MQRRLAAILAADVVGYSRLMELDEAGTLTALKAHRAELIDPTVAAKGGRMVKLMGDGALVEFPSVVDALSCAVAIQKGMAERNRAVAPERRIAFRVGINLGDVIVEGEDLYGGGGQRGGAPGGACRAGRNLPFGYRLRHGPRQSRNRLRGSGPAQGQEPGPAGPGLPGAR